MNCIKKEDIDLFVKSVSGKNLSIRDIEILAHGYFKGSEELCDQIKNGNIQWGLKQLKESSTGVSDCTGIEQKVLRELKITLKYMQQVIYISCDTRLKTAPFNVQANLLAEGILRQVNAFEKAVRELHDRSGQTPGNILSL